MLVFMDVENLPRKPIKEIKLKQWSPGKIDAILEAEEYGKEIMEGFKNQMKVF